VTIQDAIAEVIYNKVRASPEKYHPRIVAMAVVVDQYAHTYSSREIWFLDSPSWRHFKEELEHYGCTENGQDARKD
jgi:hypothetical protein